MAQPTKTIIFNLTAIPTPLPPTPIPLADLDIASILVQPGDLPAGYSGTQVRSDPSAMFEGIHQPVNQIYQQFECNNGSAGGIAFFVYDKQLNADNAYNLILGGMGETTESVPNIGVRARILSMDLSAIGGAENLELLFFRRNTVIHIRMSDTTNKDYITSYAQKLDERFTPLVCR
jgi:hypothetical protein